MTPPPPLEATLSFSSRFKFNISMAKMSRRLDARCASAPIGAKEVVG